MKRPWKIALIVLGSIAVLLLVVIGVFTWWWLSPSTWERVEKLGGGWVLVEDNSLIVEAGSKHPRIERVHGRERTLVAPDPFPYKYIGDDCLLFTNLERNMIEAACGDAAPIDVVPTGDFHKEPDTHWAKLHNAVTNDPLQLNGTEIAWSEIKAHARAGKPFEMPKEEPAE